MAKLKETLIRRARQKHPEIFPCANKRSIQECFTESENRLIFWYNTSDRNTHVETARLRTKRSKTPAASMTESKRR